MNIFGVVIGFLSITAGFDAALRDLITVSAAFILLGCWLVLKYGSRLLDGGRK